jgi:hypothetical protein
MSPAEHRVFDAECQRIELLLEERKRRQSFDVDAIMRWFRTSAEPPAFLKRQAE